MSTGWNYVCASHEPRIEIDEGGVNDSGLERMRELYAHREQILAAIATLQDLDFDVWNFDPDEKAAVRAFRQHPTCLLVARDEYGNDAPLEQPAQCIECPEPVAGGVHVMCASCLHNALRSGWAPGGEA